VVMSVNWCPTAGLLVPISTALHHPTGDRKPGKAFTSLTVLVGEWEGQLPSRIRPGKIGRSQISALDITPGATGEMVHSGSNVCWTSCDVAYGTRELSVVLASQRGVEHGS